MLWSEVNKFIQLTLNLNSKSLNTHAGILIAIDFFYLFRSIKDIFYGGQLNIMYALFKISLTVICLIGRNDHLL